MTTAPLTELVDELQLINHKRKRIVALEEAVTVEPVMTLSMTGANTLDIPLADASRKVLRTELIQYRSWAEVAGIRFELVAISKYGDQLTLRFEDSIAAALRRHTKALSAPAGSTTRREFVIRLAREARVPYAVDPEKRAVVAEVLERSVSGKKSNSWDVLADIASKVNWRRFSDTKRLIVGGDPWLMDRDKKPTLLQEAVGGVHSIDFDLNVGKRVSTATVTVDSKLFTLRPGSVCLMGDDMGPAEGKWLVSEFRRPLASTRGNVTLVRAKHVLKEPKRKGKGDPGDPDFVPGAAGTSQGGAAANPAREKLVQFALSQRGDAYDYGATGPNAWDCSALVQASSRAAGRPLPRTSAEQWGACVRAGRTIPVRTALGIRGALLFRIGVGEFNHVAISLGNGSTMEARGTGYGTGIFGDAGSQGWTGGALWV